MHPRKNIFKGEFKIFGNVRLDYQLTFQKELTNNVNASLRIRGEGQFEVTTRLQKLNNFKILDCSQQNYKIDQEREWVEINLSSQPLINNQELLIRMNIKGQGNIWIEDLIQPLNQSDNNQDIGKYANWLKSQIVPISSEGVLRKEDISQVEYLFQDAKIIALGEVTHGSGSIFDLKRRIIQVLIRNYEFQTILEEIPLPESKHINSFVLNKKKRISIDSAKACWNLFSEEHLRTLSWIRKHNQYSDSKVNFIGYDISINLEGLNEILKEIEEFNPNNELIPLIQTLKRGIFFAKSKGFSKCIDSSLNYSQIEFIENSFSKIESWITKNINDNYNKNWLLMNLINSKQLYESYQKGILRDYFLAKNVDINFLPQKNLEKVIISGHNAHVNKTFNKMGGHLSQKYGNKYVAIGFAFHQGEYSSGGPVGITSYKAQNSYQGSFEYIFDLVGSDNFILDLRKIKLHHNNDPNASWLFKTLDFRDIGSYKSNSEFSKYSLVDQFDILIFIKKSRASKLK